MPAKHTESGVEDTSTGSHISGDPPYAAGNGHGSGEDSGEEDDRTLYHGEEGLRNEAPAIANYVVGSNTLESSLEGTTLNDGDIGDKHDLNFSQINQNNNGHELDAAHLKQMKYNQNKMLLDRCLNSASALFRELRDKNVDSPIHYPIEQMSNSNGYDSKLNSIASKRALRAQLESGRELSEDGEDNVMDFKFDILRLDLKMGAMNSTESLITNFDNTTISVLLVEKFNHILSHLQKLKDRVDDTCSKVLITGDLNSGKSSFCNALLRREIMPVDQQPCTNVFCEIINHYENHSVEEVHAVPIGATYNINDQNTYNKYSLERLEDLVYESDKFSILKVYVNDNRPMEESLLKNGIIDIRLIDAPGLNLDSYQTMQLFSRQEEIDLVVFVVSAENHFTLSGREFISNVNNDKKFTFIVVNKFDSIKRKDKCVEKIMQQVGDLSPETHKDSDDFVHFVSSEKVLKRTGGGGGDGGDGGDGDGDGDPTPNDGNGGIPDFDRLEASLRNFVVDKRSVSKLLPAKNYLSKIFNETLVLVRMNVENYSKIKDETTRELNEIKPKYDEVLKTSVRVNEKIMSIIDESSEDVYENTRRLINEKIDDFTAVKEIDGSVTIFNIDQFIQRTKLKVVHDILSSIEDAEDYGRLKTLRGIEEIRLVGKKVLGEEGMPEHKFKPESMYAHKKDRELKNKININFEMIDMIDFDSIIGFFRNLQSLFDVGKIAGWIKGEEMNIGTILSSGIFKTSISSLLILYGPRLISITTGLGSVMRLPKVVTFGSLAICVGYPIYYVIKESPKTVHKNIVKKIKSNLQADDYIHLNSMRISKEVRKVLNYPAKDVSVGINGLIERESNLRSELVNRVNNMRSNVKFLKGLEERVVTQRDVVNAMEVD